MEATRIAGVGLLLSLVLVFGACQESAALRCHRGKIEVCEELCEGGDMQACVHLGHNLVHGGPSPSGRKSDDPRSVRSAAAYRKACEAAVADGCCGLADAYRFARGVVADKRQAVALYERACDGGSGMCCFSLGNAREFGILGLEADPVGAGEAYEAGCRIDYDAACEALKELRREPSPPSAPADPTTP